MVPENHQNECLRSAGGSADGSPDGEKRDQEPCCQRLVTIFSQNGHRFFYVKSGPIVKALKYCNYSLCDVH
jgi:hypothetical protein